MNTLHYYIDRGRLIRGTWTGTDEHGRELLCILAAMWVATEAMKTADKISTSILDAIEAAIMERVKETK